MCWRAWASKQPKCNASCALHSACATARHAATQSGTRTHVHTRARAAAALSPAGLRRPWPAPTQPSRAQWPLAVPTPTAHTGLLRPVYPVRAGTGAQRGCIRHEHGGAVCIRPHHTPHVLLSSTISSSVHLRPAEPTRLLSCLQYTKTVPIHALRTVHSVPEANTTASGHGMGSSGSVGELAIPRNLIQWFGARTGRLVHRNCVLQTVRD